MILGRCAARLNGWASEREISKRLSIGCGWSFSDGFVCATDIMCLNWLIFSCFFSSASFVQIEHGSRQLTVTRQQNPRIAVAHFITIPSDSIKCVLWPYNPRNQNRSIEMTWASPKLIKSMTSRKQANEMNSIIGQMKRRNNKIINWWNSFGIPLWLI